MGLGAPKKRFKLSYDPNNTAWSRSVSKYGQRILQSHGWTPGNLLGTRGAAYSDLHSAASASHIRVALKDDHLGLGAKLDAAYDSSETTGLDVFQDLLGRLNGCDSTNLQKNRIQRSNLRSSAYINQRWGTPRFVSGGLLVRDGLRDLAKDEHGAPNTPQQPPSHHSDNEMLPEVERPQDLQSKPLKRKRHKKRKTSGNDNSVKRTSNGVDSRPVRAHLPRNRSVELDKESHTSSHTSSKSRDDQIQRDKLRRRAERAERKLKCHRKRDARRSLKAREQSSISPSPDLIRTSGTDVGEVAVALYPLPETSASIKGSPGLGVGRLAVRHRYVQHKKMCMMDQNALNEILMIKK